MTYESKHTLASSQTFPAGATPPLTRIQTPYPHFHFTLLHLQPWTQLHVFWSFQKKLNWHFVFLLLKIVTNCPGWCGSVDWVPACEPKSHQFYFQSRYMSGLQARSPVGCMQEATDRWISCTLIILSLFFFLPSPLCKSKWVRDIKKKKKIVTNEAPAIFSEL